MAKTENNGKNKKKRGKGFFRLILILLIFSLGVFVGIHRRVILAWIKGEDGPEPPEGHCRCPFLKKK